MSSKIYKVFDLHCDTISAICERRQQGQRAELRQNHLKVDLEKLKDAIDHPENPEYQNIIIKVTGYTTRFVCLAKPFQEEFCGRNNYGEL